jgi:hypothetical protein
MQKSSCREICACQCVQTSEALPLAQVWEWRLQCRSYQSAWPALFGRRRFLLRFRAAAVHSRNVPLAGPSTCFAAGSRAVVARMSLRQGALGEEGVPQRLAGGDARRRVVRQQLRQQVHGVRVLPGQLRQHLPTTSHPSHCSR